MTDPDLLLPMIQQTEERLRKNLLNITDVLEIVAALRRTIDQDEKTLKRLYAELATTVKEDQP